MEARGIYLRVGLLIVVGLLLVVGLVWFLGGEGFTRGTLFESYFPESVQGLEVGSAVKYRGVTIGRVTDIGLVAAEYGVNPEAPLDRQSYRLVFVRYLIDRARLAHLPDTAQAVKIGLRARLATQGLTGLTYIELDFVNPTIYPPQVVPWTPKAEYIPSMPSTLNQVQNAAQQVLAKLNNVDIAALVTSIQGLVNDLRNELAAGDAHTALQQATAFLQTLNDTVKAADIPGLTADLRRTSGSIRDVAQSEDVRRTLANAAQAADRLSVAAAKLPPLIATWQATGQRTDNSVADLQQSLVPLLRDLQVAAANLRDTSEALRRNPAQLLVGAPPPRQQVPAQ
jgi:ABC-type transporter Mla subunit MlaD